MSQGTFGVWSQYFQVIIIIVSVLMSPIQLFFSREFYSSNDKRVRISNGWFLLGFFILISFIFKFWFNTLIKETSLVILLFSASSYVIYMLNATFLRFKKEDFKYAKLSFIRMLLFVVSILAILWYKNEIVITDLIYAFFLCHIPFVLFLKRNISLRAKLEKLQIKEYLRLMIYGLSTALLSGIDRLIVVEAGYSFEKLGYYAYALAFASLPSFLVEAVKQYVAPKLFHDLSSKGDYSKKTTRLVIRFVVALIIIQFIIPIISFKILGFLGIVNLSYIGGEDFITLVTIFNIGFCFHIIYHFVNPYMFFYDRSIYLLIVQVLSILIYTIMVFLSENLNDIKLSFFRVITFFIVVFFTLLPVVNHKLRLKYVHRKL